MAPKERTKRTMTPEQLEKLAVARARANEVRQAMKEGREDAQVAALQAKMDILKAKKKPPPKEPTVPDNVEPPEPTSVPTPDEETNSNKEDKVAKPPPTVEPVPEPEPTQADPPVEKLKKKKKKVIVMPSSDTSDSEDDSNVIFVKKTSRKKKEVPAPPPRPASPQKVHYNRPSVTNPFFNFNPMASRNFM